MIGQTLGHYRILEKVGAGGMGVVYRARDEQLDRDVALKVLPSGTLSDDTARRHFRKEAMALARLNHPNIETVYEFGTQDGTDFLVMEYVPGKTLAERLTGGTIPEKEVVALGIQIAAALEEAHERGIVHRDLKPANIAITEKGRAKILDFGLAKLLQPVSEGTTEFFTDSQAAAGTLPYMPPEQLMGDPVDARADIYTIGAVLYEMATDRRAFPEGLTSRLIDAILHQPPVAPRAINPRISTQLETIILKCLDKDPDRRYQSAKELLVDLQRLGSDGKLAEARTTPASRTLWRIVLLGAGIAAVAIVVWAFLLRRGINQQSAATIGNWVLISDFDNRTGDALFDHTVRELLTLALEQSRYVRVFSSSQVQETLQRMKKPPKAGLDFATAREICIRENLGILISGEISASQGSYQITVRAVDPRTYSTKAVTLGSLTRKDELSPFIDKISQQLRRALGERNSDIAQDSKPLAQVTTSSLDALERFSLGVDLQAHGRMEEASDLYKAAVSLDPQFAMAYGRLATAEAALERQEQALHSATQAYNLRERVTERERYLIAATYHVARGEYEKALDDMRTVTALHPLDPEAQHELAQTYAVLGNLPRAIEAAKRAAELYPGSLINQGLLAVLLAEANQNDEALQIIQSARSRQLSGTYLYWGEGLAWLGKGEATNARKAFLALAEAGGVYTTTGRLYLAQAKIYQGDLGGATEQLEADLGLDLKTGDQVHEAIRRYWLSKIYILRGRRTKALRQMETLSRWKILPGNLELLRDQALLYAEMGERSRAERLLAQAERLHSEFPSNFSQAVLMQVHGELELLSGHWEAAQQDLEQAHALWGDASTIWSLANAYYSHKDYRRALTLYELLISRKGEILRWEFSGLWPLAHLQAARCYRNLADNDRATQEYNQFLQLWGENSNQIAVAEEARKEREVLSGRKQGR